MPTAAHRALLAAGLVLVHVSACPVLASSRSYSTIRARAYVAFEYTVDYSNVYPAITHYVPNIASVRGAGCPWTTRSGGTFGLNKALVGNRQGAPYSFRAGEPKWTTEIEWDLIGTAPKGAGNSCYLFNTKPAAVSNSITGIDCSQLLSAAWLITPRIDTRSIASQCYSTALQAPQVSYGDAFLKAGSHVRIFASAVNQDGTVGCYEANANRDYGRCTYIDNYNFNVQLERGFKALRYRKFQDSPAADVVGLRVARSGAGVALNWMTLSERDVDAFLVRRGANRDGPFDVLVAEVAPAATSGGSGNYEVADPSAPPGGAFYRLEERETTGAVIPRGTIYLAPEPRQQARIREVGR